MDTETTEIAWTEEMIIDIMIREVDRSTIGPEVDLGAEMTDATLIGGTTEIIGASEIETTAVETAGEMATVVEAETVATEAKKLSSTKTTVMRTPTSEESMMIHELELSSTGMKEEGTQTLSTQLPPS